MDTMELTWTQAIHWLHEHSNLYFAENLAGHLLYMPPGHSLMGVDSESLEYWKQDDLDSLADELGWDLVPIGTHQYGTGDTNHEKTNRVVSWGWQARSKKKVLNSEFHGEGVEYPSKLEATRAAMLVVLNFLARAEINFLEQQPWYVHATDSTEI